MSFTERVTHSISLTHCQRLTWIPGPAGSSWQNWGTRSNVGQFLWWKMWDLPAGVLRAFTGQSLVCGSGSGLLQTTLGSEPCLESRAGLSSHRSVGGARKMIAQKQTLLCFYSLGNNITIPQFGAQVQKLASWNSWRYFSLFFQRALHLVKGK